jgi:hypothetical protein
MYDPFERSGSSPKATHAILDKVIIEKNDVTIQFLEGYFGEGGEFTSLGADHICMTPEVYVGYEDAKSALIGELENRGQE